MASPELPELPELEVRIKDGEEFMEDLSSWQSA